MDDFRVVFKNLDDAALIGIDEYAQLMGLTTGAMSQRRYQDELAAPAIQGGKVLRWRAGDVRAWLLALNQDTRAAQKESGNGKRRGRPRNDEAGEA